MWKTILFIRSFVFEVNRSLMIFRINVRLHDFLPYKDTRIGQKIILCGKISRKFQIQFPCAKPRFQGNRTWQFFGYTCGWIIFSAERGLFYRTGDRPKNKSELRDKICSYKALFLRKSSSKIRDIWIHLVEIPSMYDRLVRQVIQNVW